SFQSLSAPPESTDINDNPFISFVSFDDLRESVHQLRDKLQDFCKEELKKISDRGKVLEIHLLSETSPSSSHIMENIILEMSWGVFTLGPFQGSYPSEANQTETIS
ncbi:hypothetical protein M9458_031441, partial [Cirrhinus mrigala]